EYRDSIGRRCLYAVLPSIFPLRGLAKGYLTELPDGRTYGETLLDATHIYAPIVAECVKRQIEVHYAVNVTGHGWRKFMRPNQPHTYVIDTLPRPQAIF